MKQMTKPAQIVILNGATRSGKSSIVEVIQETFEGAWMNLGVDVFARGVTPKRYQPGIGLRPGPGPGFGGGHHGAIHPEILPNCARQLAGLPVLFVGVRCPIEEIMKRRNQAGREGGYVVGTDDEPVPPPVVLWQREVHIPGIYDLEVDTSLLSPEECAEVIRRRLEDGPSPSAFQQLAKRAAS